MKAKTFLAIATLLAFGQGAWADGTTSFPLHYNAETNPEDGSEAHPYQIQSVSDLNALASDVNSGTNYSGKYFKLTADLNYSGETFTTIGKGEESGSEDFPFKGIFDGDGKKISNITYSDANGVGVGLFGYIYSPAQIRNVKLENCSFTGNCYVGAIVGFSSGTASGFGIYDCTVDGGSVTATTIDAENAPDMFAGGVIGYCGNLQVSNCTSSASVSGSSCVGGIAGILYEGTIQDCFYTGTTTFTDATTGPIAGDRGGVDNDDNFIVGSEGTINLTLYDADGDAIDNATRLGYYNGIENVDVTLSGRTLYKDNSWNTICLPFAMTAEQVTAQLAPTKLMTLSTATFDDGTLTLNFADATEIEAGKPYIIKWTGNTEWGNPTFTGVTVSSAAPTDVTGTAANFHGIYTPYSTGGENKSMLYLGAENKIYYPNADMTINAFRAYFTLNNGITVGDLPQQARAFVLNFGDESTGIISIDNGQLIIDNSMDAWYSLDGRRLTGKPSRAGVYINNGKKIVIK
ncbi:MAG: GLUG domain-containing protein [bacterium F083]|nr:MAG: GLUG domain-containing protein [bacterium F083]